MPSGGLAFGLLHGLLLRKDLLFFVSSILTGQEVRPNQQRLVEVWLLVSSTGCSSGRTGLFFVSLILTGQEVRPNQECLLEVWLLVCYMACSSGRTFCSLCPRS